MLSEFLNSLANHLVICAAKNLWRCGVLLILCVGFLSAAWAQKPANNTLSNWSSFLTSTMARNNPYETVLGVNNVGTMQLKWSWNAGTDRLSSPTVVDGRVYFQENTAYGGFQVLDANTGVELWQNSTGSSSSQPAVDNGIVYYGNGWDGTVAWNAITGALVWGFSLPYGIPESLTAVDGVAYFGTPYGGLYAVNGGQDGGQVWYDSTPSIGSTVAVVNDVVYVMEDTGDFLALDAKNGSWLWGVSLVYGGTSPAVANGTVYIGADGLYALNATTGAMLWNYGVGMRFNTPAVANGVVFTAAGDSLYAINATTGTLEWSTVIAGGLSAPAVANGVVYVGTVLTYAGNKGGDSLFALNASTGEVLWSYLPKLKQDNFANVSPAVANGRVYFVCDNTSICAFGPLDEKSPAE